jgi:alkanesulfonate monooxygenase SsuD/methylene tetrahydromethanopterin reductase-like flavin-dependent oxidoreductase (luciferase family)
MEIWVGALKPRMLALTGRKADGWIPSSSYAPSEKLPEMNRRIDEAASAAGRAPGQIRRMYNVSGRITTGERAGYLEGPVDDWVSELIRLVELGGMDSFIFAPQQPGEEQIRLFAEQVVPRVRSHFQG